MSVLGDREQQRAAAAARRAARLQARAQRDHQCQDRDRLPVGEIGWPRPHARFNPSHYDTPPEESRRVRLLPVPWIAALQSTGAVEWTGFHRDADRAHHQRLCQICGQKLHRLIVLARAFQEGETSGPGGHPRCMALAAQSCPHLLRHGGEDAVVAYLYDGPGLGYVSAPDWTPAEGETMYSDTNGVDSSSVPLTRGELKALARRDPLGDRELVAA